MLLGTFALYNAQEFNNFRLEVDVIANDNDGMGIVWGYKDLEQHGRVMLMNDRWPEVPPLDGEGIHGPYVVSHKRIGNETPWYELIEYNKDDYLPYAEGFDALQHWTLEMVDGQFKFTMLDEFTGDENILEGFDDSYQGGLVGIQLYAQQAEFDNFTITPLGGEVRLQAGDADQDLDFDQLDLVAVQIAAKYLSGEAATWGEGDWNGAPGGSPGDPPAG